MLADLRYALRSLAAHRWFSGAAVLTLALGIGANTAIFTVVNGVLLRPLPYRQPDRLVRIYESLRGGQWNVAYPNYLDWRSRNHVFAEMAVFNTFGSVAVSRDGTVRTTYPSGHTEPRLFDVLGVRAAAGRVLGAADVTPDTPVVAVVTDAFWRAAFAGDPSLVGRTVRMDDDEVTVVGILPPNVRPFNVDVWFPIRHLVPMQLDRGNHPGFGVVARLRDGIGLDAARREMNAIAGALQREYPATNRDMGVTVTPLLDTIAGDVRPALLTLMGAVALLLLIACANVANLLVAKGVRRQRETSIRAALGASRARLVRLLLIEGLTIGACGAAAGVIAAAWGVRALRAVPGLVLPRASDVRVDPRVLAFAAALGVLTALLFALAPALQLSRVDLMRILRLGAASDSTNPGSARARSLIVAIEVGLLVVLLVGAALMQRTLANLAGVSLGFDADRLLSVRLQEGPSAQSPEAVAAHADSMVDGILRAGRVADAAVAWPFDYTGSTWAPFVNLPDRPFEPGREPVVQMATVSRGYFATMGIPLIRGRLFGPEDRPGAPLGLVVNQTFVRTILGGRDPIGVRVNALKIPQMQNMPIIGVVGDTRRGGVLRGFTPEAYVSFAQFPVASPTLVVRAASGDPLALARDVEREVGAMDSSAAVVGVRRVADQVAASYGDRRALSWLLSMFAGLALALTVLGIGSVVSFSVAQRTGEIGIRIALGAARADVLGLILAGAMRPVAAGAVAGLLALVPASRALRSYLYGVGPMNPAAIAAALGVLFVTALAAAYIPARRAMSVDPLRAIRL